MRLIKQIKLLSWGTPIQVVSDEVTLFSGSAKNALNATELNGVLNSSIKTVKLNTAVNPVLQIIIQPMEGKINESKG